MKPLLFSLLIMSGAFAQSSYMNPDEARYVNDYLDMICMDTYCGGDLNYYPQGIKCDEDSCVVGYVAYEWYANTINPYSYKALIGTTDEDTQQNVEISYTGLHSKTGDDDDTLYGMEFSCKLGDLPKGLDLKQKQDLFYDKIVFSCIDLLESASF